MFDMYYYILDIFVLLAMTLKETQAGTMKAELEDILLAVPRGRTYQKPILESLTRGCITSLMGLMEIRNLQNSSRKRSIS